ncbi:MAG TPA: sulfite exporter TauE/SafE family protein [Roseateles sp.]|nr:sulfite exporter TauE/SafE family protein [Roseateles sp.]
MDEPVLLIWIALSFLAAGVVKGVSGMGLPTLAMALLSLRMPAAEAAALMLLPALLTNIAQCRGPHGALLLRRLWPLWAGMALGALFSPVPDLAAGGGAARWALGAVLVGYGLWGLRRPELPAPGRHEPWLGALAGLASGALTAATGVFVLPMVPYLQALRLDRDALIQALGLSFTVASLALAARLGQLDGNPMAALDARAGALALLTAFAGMALGARLRGRLPPLTFQRALYGVFLLLGLLMLRR